MKFIMVNAHNLAHCHAVKLTRPEVYTKLEVLIKEINSMDPSPPVGEAASQTFKTDAGPQNVSMGSSTQYNSFNTGSGTVHNYGGIRGHTLNFGKD